jgi:hypothetical protein
VICLLSVALLSVGGSGAWAQQPKENQPYTIQQTVRRVVLDVVVTDSHHHEVSGLKPRDFEVLEANKPQAVLSFAVRLKFVIVPVTCPSNICF